MNSRHRHTTHMHMYTYCTYKDTHAHTHRRTRAHTHTHTHTHTLWHLHCCQRSFWVPEYNVHLGCHHGKFHCICGSNLLALHMQRQSQSIHFSTLLANTALQLIVKQGCLLRLQLSTLWVVTASAVPTVPTVTWPESVIH